MSDTLATLALVATNQLSLPARVWQANQGRTLSVGPVGGAGPVYGITTSPNAQLIWPAKDAAEFLDFSLNIAPWIGIEGDVISAVSAIFTDTNLSLLSQVATSTTATFWFAGGTAGQNALIDVTMRTNSGRIGRFSVTLPIAALDAVELSLYAPPTPTLAPASLLGRATGSGPPEPIYLGTGFALIGNVLNVSPNGGQNTAGPEGPAGPPVMLTIGEVTSVPAGTPASASITGSGTALALNLSLETGHVGLVGDAGPPPVITIGTVTELAPDAAPTATLVGEAGAYVLNLGIPQGDIGPPGAASEVPGPKGDQGLQGDQGPSGNAGPQPVDLYAFVANTALPGQVLLSIVLAREITFPPNLAGSAITLLTAANQQAVLNLTQNGNAVGTGTVAAGSMNAAMASPGFVGNPGDVIQWLAPNPADATASGFQITLTGTR